MANAEQYYIVHDWMTKELGLSGNEKDIYAIVYGYTQYSKKQAFTLTRKYLCDMLNISEKSVDRALDSLVNRGLLTKESNRDSLGHIRNTYKAVRPSSQPDATDNRPTRQGDATPTRQSDALEIYNTTNSSIGGDNKLSPQYCAGEDDIASKLYSKEDFLGSRKKSTSKPKKLNLYQQCVLANEQFTDDAILQELLKSYLQLRLKMTDKSHIYAVGQWNAMLEKLYKLDRDNYKQREIVKTAIERGWAAFFPVDDKKKSNYRNTGDTDASGNKSVTANKIRKGEDDDDETYQVV